MIDNNNLTGFLSQSDIEELRGKLSTTLSNMGGSLSSIGRLQGKLGNATLRGIPVELRMNESLLQWRYTDEEEWRDLIDLQSSSYEQLANKPTINGHTVVGEMGNYIMTTDDQLSNSEIANILNG